MTRVFFLAAPVICTKSTDLKTVKDIYNNIQQIFFKMIYVSIQKSIGGIPFTNISQMENISVKKRLEKQEKYLFVPGSNPSSHILHLLVSVFLWQSMHTNSLVSLVRNDFPLSVSSQITQRRQVSCQWWLSYKMSLSSIWIRLPHLWHVLANLLL